MTRINPPYIQYSPSTNPDYERLEAVETSEDLALSNDVRCVTVDASSDILITLPVLSAVPVGAQIVFTRRPTGVSLGVPTYNSGRVTIRESPSESAATIAPFATSLLWQDNITVVLLRGSGGWVCLTHELYQASVPGQASLHALSYKQATVPYVTNDNGDAPFNVAIAVPGTPVAIADATFSTTSPVPTSFGTFDIATGLWRVAAGGAGVYDIRGEIYGVGIANETWTALIGRAVAGGAPTFSAAYGSENGASVLAQTVSVFDRLSLEEGDTLGLYLDMTGAGNVEVRGVSMTIRQG